MKEDSTAALHKVGTREEWLAARLNLLKEKEHARRGDELAPTADIRNSARPHSISDHFRSARLGIPS